MPISARLSKGDSAEAALLDIERRRLSSKDMYVHAVSTMVRRLDLMRLQLEEFGTEQAIATSTATSAVIEDIVGPSIVGTWRMDDITTILGTLGTVQMLSAYGRVRDSVSAVWNAHQGSDHDESCYVCRALCDCAGMIYAVEYVLKQSMERSKTLARQQKRYVSPHKTVPVLTHVDVGNEWQVLCVLCGVVARVPERNVITANELARTHERATPPDVRVGAVST